MNLLFFPELFYQITTSLNDKEKIFLTSCSKITYKLKSLLTLDSEYNLEEINDKWHMKNIIIKEYSLWNKIKLLIKDLIIGSIVINSKYAKFISNNISFKLFFNKEIIEKMVSYNKCSTNINKQFIEISCYSYSNIVKSLIDLCNNIRTNDNETIVYAQEPGAILLMKKFPDSQ